MKTFTFTLILLFSLSALAQDLGAYEDGLLVSIDVSGRSCPDGYIRFNEGVCALNERANRLRKKRIRADISIVIETHNHDKSRGESRSFTYPIEINTDKPQSSFIPPEVLRAAVRARYSSEQDKLRLTEVKLKDEQRELERIENRIKELKDENTTKEQQAHLNLAIAKRVVLQMSVSELTEKQSQLLTKIKDFRENAIEDISVSISLYEKGDDHNVRKALGLDEVRLPDGGSSQYQTTTTQIFSDNDKAGIVVNLQIESYEERIRRIFASLSKATNALRSLDGSRDTMNKDQYESSRAIALSEVEKSESELHKTHKTKYGARVQ